jgi:hypothetical protein
MTDFAGLIAYLGDPESERRMAATILENLAFYQNVDTDEKLDEFTGSIYNWFIRECVGRNQYLVFPERAYERIFALYKRLVARLRGVARERGNADAARAILGIVREHRAALIAIVRGIDPAGTSRASDGVILPCAEYSAEFQLSVLGLDPDSIEGPFLDVGCGERASLVRELRSHGIDAVGIDQYRISDDGHTALRASWLEFRFVPDYWGTIASHMAFSNHFVRAMKTDPELAALYHAVYRDILESLKVGGAFCSAPAVPRAEAFIDRARFSIERFENIPGDETLDTVRVTRLA